MNFYYELLIFLYITLTPTSEPRKQTPYETITDWT